jgi:hypothetical protein
MRFQELPNGGQITLRSGGDYIVSTARNMMVTVGDVNRNIKGQMIEKINGKKHVHCEDFYINRTEKSHIFLSKSKIALLAGESCSLSVEEIENITSEELGNRSPCVGQVAVFIDGKLKASNTVFASVGCEAKALVDQTTGGNIILTDGESQGDTILTDSESQGGQ